MQKYSQTYPIVASDMDITYHITPNAVLLYFQDCFARFLTTRHLAAFDIINDHLIWVIYDFDLTVIDRRPLWSDNVRVEIWFSKITPVKIFVNYRVYDENDAPFAEGSSCWVVINSDTKRPFAAKDMLANAGIEAIDDTIQNVSALPKPDNANHTAIEHRVNVTDLDFNGHVCNRSYISIAMGAAPVGFVMSYIPQHMHVKFVREAFINQVLTCRIIKSATKPNTFWHQIVNAEGQDICHIYSEWKENNEGNTDDVARLVRR